MEEHKSQKKQSEHLERLLTYVSPLELRKSVQKTLFAYLFEQDEKGLDADFKKIVEDHFFLIDFLDKIENPN